MSISLDQNEIDGGYPVFVTAKVKNVSEKLLLLVEDGSDVDFSFEIKDRAGKQVDDLQYQKRLREGPGVYRSKVVTVSPGEQIEYKLNLSRRFDMSLDGTYTVQAYRSVLKLEGEGGVPLASNVEILVIR